MSQTFYITTPIYYVNAEPHLGHLYATMFADTVRRFQRQRGCETYFLTGTDEHSQKIERAADAAGMPVAAFVDDLAGRFRKSFDHWGLEYDQFIRTTFDYHKKGAQALWRKCNEAGDIYKGEYAGWYCHKDNAFVDGPADASTPPACPECGRVAEWLAEESYFFRLSTFKDRLLAYYAANPNFIQPESRRNEIVSFVEGGLKDLSISRVTTSWGVPVPDDERHVMYVWFDALSNYITALGYGDDKSDLWRFWPAVHLIGKDIVRFHTVYWPALLMSAGVELPREVLVHGMWLSGGRRMSKTEGNGVDIGLLDRHFSHDAVRFFCMSEMAFGQDGDFTYEALINRANADLANGLGNLSSRTLTMLGRYFDGRVPDAVSDDAVRTAVLAAVAESVRAFAVYDFRRGIDAVRGSIGIVDKFLSDRKPWAVAKDESRRAELASILVTAIEALRLFTIALASVLPDSAPVLWRQMALAGDPALIDPSSATWGAFEPGHAIGDVTPVFPKLNKEQIMSDITNETTPPAAAEPAAAPAAAIEPAPQVAEPEYIAIEDFAKIELKAGEIIEASRIEGADKLLKLKVDVGEPEARQILAGIALHYTPEQLVGRKIVIVANLKPRKMRGLESQGMLLAASLGDEGRPVIATFDEEVPNGARLK